MSPCVVLVGLPGVGKTSVGRVLAELLGCRFADSDVLVAGVFGDSVEGVFSAVGENGFRTLEERVIRSAVKQWDGVLALGGGAVETPDVRTHVAGLPVVWLDTPVPVLETRLAGDTTRPLLSRGLSVLAETRTGLYDSVATMRVDTEGLTVPEVADEIAARLGPAS